MANYIETLSPEQEDAVLRVHARTCGDLESDLWPARQGTDEAAKERDYQRVAELWQWLHPSSKLDVWDAAEAWIRDFINDFLGQPT